MYPARRTFISLFKAKRKPKLTHPFETNTVTLRVWPWDIDLFWELNNGRFLTLMDIGRFTIGTRIGLFKVLKDNQWGLMVAAVSTRFRRRFRVFQKFNLHSQIIYYDDRWIYFRQWFERNGVIHASALVRTAVTAKNGLVPTTAVLNELKYDKETFEKHNKTSAWIEQWIKSDELHKQIMENSK